MSCRHQKAALCFECYRREREGRRAMLPLEAEAAPPLRVQLSAPAVGRLGDRELTHRRAMLAHQERSAPR